MKTVSLLFLSIMLISISCEKEKTTGFLTPTDHEISTIGQYGYLEIALPQKGVFYHFFPNDTATRLSYYDYSFSIPVRKNEMNRLFELLSDTMIFQWKWSNHLDHTVPYPVGRCRLLINVDRDYQGKANGYYECNIGIGDSAKKIFSELSKSFTGDAKEAFDEIIEIFENGAEKDLKYFDTTKLASIDLINNSLFWEIEDTNFIQGNGGFMERHFPGHQKTIGCYSYIDYPGSCKIVAISVYASQEVALNAIKSHESTIMWFEGGDEIEGQWRYSPHARVYINRWNTLITVGYFNDGCSTEFFNNNLKPTAIDLANKVEELCLLNE